MIVIAELVEVAECASGCCHGAYMLMSPRVSILLICVEACCGSNATGPLLGGVVSHLIASEVIEHYTSIVVLTGDFMG